MNIRKMEIKFDFINPLTGDSCGGFDLRDSKSIQYYIEQGYISRIFTGLQDKNGDDIYEGDILKTGYGSIYFVEYIWCMFKLAQKSDYSESKDGFYRIELQVYGKDSEIIGNIYQNPELLEKEND